MARKALLIFALTLISLTGLLALSGTLVDAAVGNLRISSATCGAATATVAYDGTTGGTGTNQIRITIKINATGTILFQSSQTVPGAAQDVTTIATWASQPESTVIQVLAEQIDSTSTVLSSNLVTYTCSASGSQVGPTSTPGPGTPTVAPVVATATPTPLNAMAQEAARGVTRIYDDFTTAVIFRLPSGDVQYYHFPEPARFVGNTPAGVLNPALYPAGQLVGQYTAVDGWRVDLYFQGGNQWRAVFFDAGGQLRADAYFSYGNPALGAGGGSVVQVPQLGLPQIYPGIGNLANPFVPLQPVPVNLFPYVVVPQAQQQVVVPVAPVQVVQPQVIPVPASGGLTVAVRVSLNVRSGPSLSAARLGVMSPGTQVSLYARDSSGLWAYGAASNGLVGWMSTRYLSANLAQILALGVAR